MSFEKIFESWLTESLAEKVPESVKAFSFNLYEPAFINEVTFGIELIGAETFDENDEDWACEEIWEPQKRGINIPTIYSGKDWEACLEKVKVLLEKKLTSNSTTIQKLKSREGIGIGFVDGNIEIIWKP